MSVYDASSPMSMAARLATYISDPSTIRVRVLEHYGRAPSVERCANLRKAAIREREREKEIAARRTVDYKLGDTLGCGHPNTDENITFVGEKTVCLTCEKARIEAARLRWATRMRVKADLISDEHRARPTYDAILSPSQRVLKAACFEFQVPHEALIGPSRDRGLANARFAVALVLREADPLKYTTPVIAAVVRRKEHTTIQHGSKRARELVQQDALYAARVEALREAFAAGPEKVPGDVVDALMRDAA